MPFSGTHSKTICHLSSRSPDHGNLTAQHGMSKNQRKLLKDYINAWRRTASMLRRTGERLEDFSDQNLLGAALLVAYHDEALQLIVEHVAQNN
jgi:hypothetical protein